MAESMPTHDPLEQILARRADFLAFATKRLGDRAAAEDALQEALAKATTHVSGLDDRAHAVAWFYRILERRIIDQRRRDQTAKKAHEAVVAESHPHVEAVERAPRPCACVTREAESLKPEYETVLRRVELDGASVTAFAKESGLSPTNARVRLFRARAALRSKVERRCGGCCENGGCVDCTCDH